MADDARISTALPRHPKTVKLQRRLGVSGCWHLICLFLWVAENRADGHLAGMTAEDVEIAAGWSGQTGDFTRILVDVGFLDGAEGEYIVHDWYEHNPWAANRSERKKAAQDAANIRWERERMRVACEPHTGSNTSRMRNELPTTRPDPTRPNLTKKQSGADAPADWIPTDAWAGFVDMRRKTREPLTDRAVTLIVTELDKLRAAGHDVGAVLDQSTRNNWKDVYPLKGHNSNGNGSGQRQAGLLANRDAAREGIMGRRPFDPIS